MKKIIALALMVGMMSFASLSRAADDMGAGTTKTTTAPAKTTSTHHHHKHHKKHTTSTTKPAAPAPKPAESPTK
jgi:hypothetical protein